MFQTTLRDPKIVGIRVWKAQDLRTDFSSAKKHKKHTTKWRIVYIGGSKKKYSEVVDSPDGHPEWNHEVSIKLVNRHEPLSILIVDSENNHAGQVILPLTQFTQMGPQSEYHALESAEMENDPALKVECLDITKKNNSPKGRLYFWAWVKEYREDSLEGSTRLDAKRSSGSVLHLPTGRDIKHFFHSTHHLRIEDDDEEPSSSIDSHSRSGSKSLGKKIKSKLKPEKRGLSVPESKMRGVLEGSFLTLSNNHHDSANRRSTYAPDMHFDDDTIADSLSEYSGSVRSSNMSEYLSRYDSLRSTDAAAVSERMHTLQDDYKDPEEHTDVFPQSATEKEERFESTNAAITEKPINRQQDYHLDNSSNSSISSFRMIGARKNEEPIFTKTISNPPQTTSHIPTDNPITSQHHNAFTKRKNDHSGSLLHNTTVSSRATYPDSGIGLQGDEHQYSSPPLSHTSPPPPCYPPPIPPPRLSQMSLVEDEVTAAPDEKITPRAVSSECDDSRTLSRLSNKGGSKLSPSKVEKILFENEKLNNNLGKKEEYIQQLESKILNLQNELHTRSCDVDRLAAQLCGLQSRLMIDGLFQYLEH